MLICALSIAAPLLSLLCHSPQLAASTMAYPGVKDSGMTSKPVSLKAVTRVAVTGGTFGNKLDGVYLAKKWVKDPSELQRQTFNATPCLVNPRAVKVMERFTDKDINTCFLESILSAPDTKDTPYEEKRAKELNLVFGPKGSPNAYDLLLDMHSNPTNLGATIILDNAENYLGMHLAHYVQNHFPFLKTNIYLNMSPKNTSGRITTIVRCGITLEIGPVSLQTLSADAYKHMRDLVKCCLDFTDKFNQGVTFPAFETEAYQKFGIQDYPIDSDGEISAMVHPKLQRMNPHLLASMLSRTSAMMGMTTCKPLTRTPSKNSWTPSGHHLRTWGGSTASWGLHIPRLPTNRHHLPPHPEPWTPRTHRLLTNVLR